MNRPAKPHPDFPLSPMQNGQWFKKINSKPYYFGSWKDDPKGERAIREYNERLPGILGGTDHLRHLESKGQASVGELMGRYLSQRRLDVAAGSLSPATLGDIIAEVEAFVAWIKPGTAVANLKPEHFTGYVNSLVETRGLKARARKRVQAYIKTMFRWGSGNGHCPSVNFGTAFKSPATTTQAIRKEKARAGLKDYSNRIVSGTEVDAMLKLAQPNFRAMILLAVNCGLGPADLGRMRWRNLDLERGTLDYPRHKTGNDRRGFLWKKTREALAEVAGLKHTAAALAKDGKDALVFVTRKRLPYYWEEMKVEDGKVVGVVVHNSVSLTISRLAKKAKLDGVTAYRFRHTFKTLGKKAKDIDALNLCMGHKTNSVEEGYDHEEIEWGRIRRVALVVKKKLWPKPKQAGGTGGATTLKLVNDGPAEGLRRAG